MVSLKRPSQKRNSAPQLARDLLLAVIVPTLVEKWPNHRHWISLGVSCVLLLVRMTVHLLHWLRERKNI